MNKIKINEITPESEIYIMYIPTYSIEILLHDIVEKIVYTNNEGLLAYNECEKERVYDLAFIGLSTNIELSGSDYSDYDILYTNGVLKNIFANEQYMRYKTILNNMLKNELQYNSLSSVVSKSLEKTNNILQNVANASINMLDKGDPNKIAKYLSKGIEIFSKQIEGLDISKKIEVLTNGKN